jgi:pilus assembly protein CpaC
MQPMSSSRQCLNQRSLRLALLVCAGLCFQAARAAQAADPPACPATIGGLPLPAPLAPEKAPRPASGPQSVAAFVEGLTTNDATIEVMVGQGRILTVKEDLAAKGKQPALVAVGDPGVLDIRIVSARQIRLIGKLMGVTDLSITTSDSRTYSFEIHVVADLDTLRAQLRCLFPDASLKLGQIRDHIVVEGEARDSAQVARIMETINNYLRSVAISQERKPQAQQGGRQAEPSRGPPQPKEPPSGQPEPPAAEQPTRIQAAFLTEPRVINLIHVPGSQQVLLKVRVAELNRTGMREIGADWLVVDAETGTITGTQIGGATIQADGTLGGSSRRGGALSGSTTVFGIFPPSELHYFMSALRKNSLIRILAEPNLIAMNGQAASFLAGGEFPVPIPQTSTGGTGTSVTVVFKEFGVRLTFVPTILDGDNIRLSVDPEVSSIDFSIGTVLVPGGSPVPGLNVRKAHTTVELRQGQTLAMAGLLQLTLDAQTTRIPGLGDLPILGPFFSNTTHQRVEKELVILVSPYLVESLGPDQVPPSPGEEVKTPTDFEFYLLNRIEGRTGVDWRSTTEYDDALRVLRCFLRLEEEHVHGPHGFCD